MLDRPSAIREMMKMTDARNMKALGLDPSEVISFGGGWVGHHAPERLRSIYTEICSDRELFHQVSNYPPTAGTPDCRRALAWMDESLFGVRSEEENVLISHSSTQLTHDLIKGLVSPGEPVVVLDPTYANFRGQLEFALSDGVRAVPVVELRSFDPESWAFMPDIDRTLVELESVFRERRPKALLLPSPDNPTSQVVPHAFMEEAYRLCEEHGCYLIIDFAYKNQCFIDTPEYFSWSPRERENLVLIYSNSKWSRGLGRRLGWITASSKVIGPMERMLAYTNLSGDGLHQLALSMYLEETIPDGRLRDYMARVRGQYEATAATTLRAIDEHCGVRRTVPQGALYTVMDMGREADPVGRDLFQRKGVLFIPGSGFGESLRNGLRASYGPLVEIPQLIDEGMKRTGERLKELGVI